MEYNQEKLTSMYKFKAEQIMEKNRPGKPEWKRDDCLRNVIHHIMQNMIESAGLTDILNQMDTDNETATRLKHGMS